MQESTQHAIRTTFEASNAGRIHFGQVVDQLVEAGIESYHVDYRCGRSTYFLPDGETLDLTFEKPVEGIADVFDGDAVRAAIRGAQQGGGDVPRVQDPDPAGRLRRLHGLDRGSARHLLGAPWRGARRALPGVNALNPSAC